MDAIECAINSINMNVNANEMMGSRGKFKT